MRWVVGLGVWNLGALAFCGFEVYEVYEEATFILSLGSVVAFFLAAAFAHRLWSTLGTVCMALVAVVGVFVLFQIFDELDYIEEVAPIGWGLVLLIVGALLSVGCGLRSVAKPRHKESWYEAPRRIDSTTSEAGTWGYRRRITFSPEDKVLSNAKDSTRVLRPAQQSIAPGTSSHRPYHVAGECLADNHCRGSVCPPQWSEG